GEISITYKRASWRAETVADCQDNRPCEPKPPVPARPFGGCDAGLSVIQGARLPSAHRAALTARSTSFGFVCQLQTETRIDRLPRHVVPPKKASPVATMRAMISSVLRSWS